MKTREIMRPRPITITASESIGAAQRVMSRSRIRHLPVLEAGRLVGMLSERDVLAARGRSDCDHDWWSMRVRDAMRPPQTAGPDDSLTEIAGRMAAHKIGSMPIVQRGKLLGIITVTDVLDAEVRQAMAPAPITLATAADAMTPLPLAIRFDAPLSKAVKMMLDHHVRHLPVIDETSTIVGVLSERDVRTAIGDPLDYIEQRREGPRVREVMTSPAITVPFDRPLLEIAKAFADTRVGALPVLDKFGALIGIVSYVDALRLLSA